MKKKIVYLVICFSALILSTSIFFLTRKPSAEQVAEALTRMTFGAPPGWELNHIGENELSKNRLSRGSLKQLVREGLQPITAGLSVSSTEFEHLNDAKVTVGLAQIKGSSGAYPFEIYVYSETEKPIASLGELVKQAWVVRHLSEKRTQLSELSYFEAMIEGIDRDGDRLVSLGLGGSTAVMAPDGSAPQLFSWEAMRRRAARKVAELTNRAVQTK